jgi:thiol-disulfide isomerase/thioredoxin
MHSVTDKPENLIPMKIYSIFALILIMSACAKSTYQWAVTDRNENIVVGKIDRSLLNDTQKFPWFNKNYEAYNSAQSTDILYLSAFKDRVTFVVFGGTWCEDTWMHLPVFFRVIDEAKFPKNAVTLYAVDRNKKTLKGEETTYGVTNVPTFIVYKDGKEIGRIVENVKKNMEADLKEMLMATNK